jgi:thioredoxin
MPVESLTGDDIESAVDAGAPVLLDFWAPWCGSCRLLERTVENLAIRLDGDVRVAKVDVEIDQAAAQRLGVMSVPTLALFRDGKEIHRITGVKRVDVIEAEIAPLLA